MPKSDAVKEEIGFLKLVFRVVVALDASLIAWSAQNFNRANQLLIVGAWFSAALFTVALVWITRLLSSDSVFGDSLMVWLPLTALAILVVGVLLVIREADVQSRR